MPQPDLKVDITELERALVIRPKFPRLDAGATPLFRDRVAPLLDGHQLVVFALGDIEFMDSSGLGCLVWLLKRLPAGGSVRLAEVADPLKKLIRLTRLEAVLPAFVSVELALA